MKLAKRFVFLFSVLSLSFAFGQQLTFNQLAQKCEQDQIIDTSPFVPFYRECKDKRQLDSVSENIQSVLVTESQKTLQSLAYAKALSRIGAHEEAQHLLNSVRENDFKRGSLIVKSEYYSALSSCAMNTESPQLSLQYAQKALEFSKKSDHTDLIQTNLSNVGVSLNALQRPEDALSYFQQALLLETNTSNKNALYIRLNIALTESTLGNLESSKRKFIEALTLIRKQNDPFAEIRTLGNIGDIYEKQDSLDLAMEYYRHASDACQKNGQIMDLIRVYAAISKVYEKSKDYQNALIYTHKSDSIRKAYNEHDKVSKSIMTIESDQEIKLREAQTKLADERRKTEAKQKWALVFFLLFILIICFILVSFNLKLKRKNQRLIEHEQKEIQAPQKVYAENDQLIQKLEQLILTKIYTDPQLSLEKLAKKLKTNRSYLSETINGHYQMTFSQWLNRVRINASKEMLASSDFNKYSIEGISKMAGFSTISTFNANFKKQTGLTPSFYRKNINSPRS